MVDLHLSSGASLRISELEAELHARPANFSRRVAADDDGFREGARRGEPAAGARYDRLVRQTERPLRP